MDKPRLDSRSLDARRLILQILRTAKRGHIGSAFSVLEILRVLYDDVLKFDPKRPRWEERDRFVLSKGHGCLALYLILAEKGFFAKEELNRFCAFDGLLAGHPEHTIAGVEASTGSLGHGFSIAVGMAMAGRIRNAQWRTFVVIGDGECNEGSVWEAALSAAHHRLSKLTVLVDYNKMQCYSKTSEILELEPLVDKWKSFGFEVKEVDGHDVAALQKVLKQAPFSDKKPSVLICHTIKGKGVPSIENNPDWHHKAKVADDELLPLLESLGKCDS